MSRRVLTPSPRPCSRRLRTFSPSFARSSATAGSTPDSRSMIFASTARGRSGRGVGGTAVLDHGQRPAELIGHVLNEARLAAAGRPFEQDRDLLVEGGLEQLYLVADGQIKRLALGGVLLDRVLAVNVL